MNFETIISLGEFGKSVADKFREHGEYEIFSIGLMRDCDFHLLKSKDPTKYDSMFDDYPIIKNDFVKLINRLESKRALFILDVSEEIGFSVLSILEQLIENGFEITFLTIIPDKMFRQSERKRLHIRPIANVIQEKARCGALEMNFIVSCENIRKIYGDIGILSYKKRISEILSFSFHIFNVFSNLEPIIGDELDLEQVCRIATIGTLDLETLNENLFYDLENVRQCEYIYGVNEDESKDSNAPNGIALIEKVNSTMFRKNIVHNFYEAPYDQYYCGLYTNFIQNIEV